MCYGVLPCQGARRAGGAPAVSSQPSNPLCMGPNIYRVTFEYLCTDNFTGHSLNLESIVDRKFGKYHVNMLMHENCNETSINDLVSRLGQLYSKKEIAKINFTHCLKMEK